jgi:hypothetical protein
MYTPQIRIHMRQEIAKQLCGQRIGVIGDGACANGEAEAVLFRWCDASLKVGASCRGVSVFLVEARSHVLVVTLQIHTKLIRFRRLEKEPDGMDLAAVVNEAIYHRDLGMGVIGDNVLAYMTGMLAQHFFRRAPLTRTTTLCYADRCAVNGVCARYLLAHGYKYLTHLGCLPHTLNHVGEKFHQPEVDAFMRPFNAMNRISQRCRSALQKEAGISFNGGSDSRWQVAVTA